MNLPPIGFDELSALAASGRGALLDLRERAAYERGHIFGATSLPRRLIEFRLPPLVTARRTPLVLCDDDGALADLAGGTLAAMGYTDVRALAGGFGAWRAAGRPVTQGINVPSKVFGEQLLHEMKTPMIGPAELQAWQRQGRDLVIVDVRTPEEYARGCVPGSVSLPGVELPLRVGDLVRDAATTVVVHCGGRTRSHIGVEALRRLGLSNPVVALENGTMGWHLAGLDLERGAARRPPPASDRARADAGVAARRILAEDRVPSMSVDALQALWARRSDDNVVVLDVRTAEEYRAGHVPGSVWAPGGQAVQATDEYVAVRAATLVLVCDDALRSAITAGWLVRMGFPRVAVLDGGVRAWQASGGAVALGDETLEPFGYAETRRSVAGVRQPRPGSRVLSVDPSDVYARGHVPGAGWVCRSRLELRIGAVAPDPGTPIVVTCIDGRHSTLAAATLAARGYRDVAVLDGGTEAWRAGGQPVEQGPTALLDEPDDVVLKAYDRGPDAMVAYLRWEEHLRPDGTSPESLFPGAGGARPGKE